MVDLVGDERDSEFPSRPGEVGQTVRRDHGAGRVGRAHHQNAGERARRMEGPHALRRRREPVLGVQTQGHRHEVEGVQDVAIGGIARRRHRHPCAGIEQAQEGQNEAGRRARRDDDALRRDGDPVGLPVMAGDALAQRGEAQGLGIGKPAAIQRMAGCRDHRTRRWSPRAGRPPCGSRGCPSAPWRRRRSSRPWRGTVPRGPRAGSGRGRSRHQVGRRLSCLPHRAVSGAIQVLVYSKSGRRRLDT